MLALAVRATAYYITSRAAHYPHLLLASLMVTRADDVEMASLALNATVTIVPFCGACRLRPRYNKETGVERDDERGGAYDVNVAAAAAAAKRRGWHLLPQTSGNKGGVPKHRASRENNLAYQHVRLHGK